MLKNHPRAVVRTTKAAAWALLGYCDTGIVSQDMLLDLADSVSGREIDTHKTTERMRVTCM